MTAVNTDKNHRIEWIDIAKGIAMLCVIAGHMEIPVVDRVVYTFHIPIFFLISGYLISREAELKPFFLKKVRYLIVPYLFTGALLVIAKIPVDMVLGRRDMILSDMREEALEVLYASGHLYNKTFLGIGPVGAIWFLVALLWALALVKLLIDHKYGWIAVPVIAAISYITSHYFWLPFDIQAAGTAIVFVYIGAYARRNMVKERFDNRWWLIAPGLAVLAIEAYFDISVSVVRNYYKYTVVSVVGAVVISLSVIMISRLLEKTVFTKKVLSFWGRYSVIILCYHLIELNNMPWFMLYPHMTGIPPALQYCMVYAGKLAFLYILTMITLKIGFLRRIFVRE